MHSGINFNFKKQQDGEQSKRREFRMFDYPALLPTFPVNVRMGVGCIPVSFPFLAIAQFLPMVDLLCDFLTAGISLNKFKAKFQSQILIFIITKINSK